MTAIVDQRMPQNIQARLFELGFSVISLPPFSRLDAPVSSHPDMLMLPLGDRLFVCKEYYGENAPLLDDIANKTGRTLFAVDAAVSSQYPNDVGLNLLVFGKHLLGRIDKTPPEILDYAVARGYLPHFVKQGYAKCSTAVLGDRAIISSDPSILSAANSFGADTLAISPGGVSLPGYEYGFLGGACGAVDDRIFFCGSLDAHPDGGAITDFCRGHGFSVISLSDQPLFDVGSIFFL